MDERHHEATTASEPSHAYVCIEEMKQLVNGRVILYLSGSRPPVIGSLV
jgi:hypothetical protein